jgi:3-oxoacid CoA-transferase
LLTDRLAKKFVASYVGENKNFENQYLGGQLEFEISPQGTIAERLRCGGAGIPGFYTPTGADTMVETGDFIMKYKEGTTEAEILSKPKPTR